MKKYVLAGAMAISALFAVAAQAAPVTGSEAVQAEASQTTIMQKVHDGWGHGGWGRHRGWGGGRHHGWGYGRGWCYWHPYRCGRW
jgi:hypothetical protein